MAGFKDFVTSIALDVFNKQYNSRQPLTEKAAQNNTGQGTIDKINTDGTVHVNLNGNVIENVSISSSPQKGASVIVVAGKRVL